MLERLEMKRFKDILCVLQPDGSYEPALTRAVTLAENNQASLTVVAVLEPVTAGIGMPAGGPISLDLQDKLASNQEQQLQALVAPYRQRLPIQTRILVGVPFLEIIREVLRQGHDLLIKVPQSPDWLDRLFTSDDMHLLRKCPCPVWLIKADAPVSFRRILAAVDVDENCPEEERKTHLRMNRQILQMASTLALSEFAQLHVVHVWNAMGESTMRGSFLNMPEEQIDAYVTQVKGAHEHRLQTLMQELPEYVGQDAMEYLNPQIHLVKGWARKEIPALSKQLQTDIVVMGTVGRTGIPGLFMGNTAETILSQIDTSVLAVKPPGFTTPVTVED
jgi:nucleotide-binding universal stress UspA family protein